MTPGIESGFGATAAEVGTTVRAVAERCARELLTDGTYDTQTTELAYGDLNALLS